MRHHLPLLLLLLLPGVWAGAGERGRLCIEGAACREHVCGESVDAAEVKRRFTFVDAAGTHRLGFIAANATGVSCTGGGEVELRISSGKAAIRRAVRVALADDHGEWAFEVSAAAAGKPVPVRVQPGSYRLTVDTPYFSPARQSIAVGGVPNVVNVGLRPLPVLHGLVKIRSTGQPMAGAVVSSDARAGGTVLTDADGRFALPADPGDWPSRLTVRAVPLADATIAVPPARADATLETVHLRPARGITVSIEQTEAGQVEQVEVHRVVRERQLERVRSADIERREKAVTLAFDDLEPARYLVVARGAEPWQRRAETIELPDAGDAAVQLRIEPFRLQIHTEFDGQPLGGARIRLRNLTGLWDAEVTAGETGSADLELWQGGSFQAAVVSSAMTGPHIEKKSLTGDGSAEWRITVPAREITGAVLDARTGSPVPAASVALTVRSETGMLSFHTTTDERGRFRLAPVMHGQHSLKVGAASYSPAELTYWFREPEERRDLTIRAERTSHVRLRVSDAAGQPVAGARVIQFRNGIRMEGHTDAAGMIEVPVPESGSSELYIVLRDGSFAVRVLAGEAREASVTVPDGSSRIVLRAMSDDDEPLSNMTVVVRYNGHVLPPDVVEAVALLQRARTRTDGTGTIVLERMPPGLYELWPAGSSAQLRAVLAGLGPQAPVRLAVTPGENVAVMRFAPP